MFTASEVRDEEARIAIRRGEYVSADTARYAETIAEEVEDLIQEQLDRRTRGQRGYRFVTVSRNFPLAPAAFDLAQRTFLGRGFDVARTDSVDGRVAQMRVSW